MGLLSGLFGGARRVFSSDGAKLQPSEYGATIAKLVSHGSPERARELVALGTRHGSADSLFKRVNDQPVHAQLHLVALECSAYLMQAVSLPGVTDDVRDEVVSGMSKTFHAGVGSIAPALTHTVGVYFAALRDELRAEDQGLVLGGGPTARLVYENIVEAYQSFAPVSGLSPFDVQVTDALLIQAFLQTQIVATIEMRKQLNLRFLS